MDGGIENRTPDESRGIALRGTLLRIPEREQQPDRIVANMRAHAEVSPEARALFERLGITVAGIAPRVEAIARQHAEREQCLHQAQMLGVSLADAETFDAALIAYAQTTIHPNADVWRAGWSDAIESLKRGDGLPPVP